MGKRNIGNHEIVNVLPANAMTVADYATNKGFSTNYVYNQIRIAKEKGKSLPFKIVIFQSFNFVIPS